MTKKSVNKFTSRRGWLGAAMQVGGGATPQTVNDVNVMNFALRVENLEAAFFAQGVATYKSADFQNSAAAQALGTGTKIGGNLYSYINGIAQNEQEHVTTLIQTVYSLDGIPQAPDCYNFGFSTPDSFLQMAQTIENIAVAAYTGVIIPQFQTSNSTVNNPAVQALMASIATVEGRHSSFINLLNMAIPFPNPLDSSQTMAQVLAAITPFLQVGCDPPPIPLTLAVAGPAKNSTLSTKQSSVPLDASLSSSATGQPLTYLWQQNLGSPPLQILNDTAVKTTAILGGGAGEYVIALKVTDSMGGSDQDTLKVIYQP